MLKKVQTIVTADQADSRGLSNMMNQEESVLNQCIMLDGAWMNVHSEESLGLPSAWLTYTKQDLKQKRMEIGISQIGNTTLIFIILLPKFNNMNFSHIYLTSLLQSLLRFRQSQPRTKLRFVNLSVPLTFSAFENRIKILILRDCKFHYAF